MRSALDCITFTAARTGAYACTPLVAMLGVETAQRRPAKAVEQKTGMALSECHGERLKGTLSCWEVDVVGGRSFFGP